MRPAYESVMSPKLSGREGHEVMSSLRLTQFDRVQSLKVGPRRIGMELTFPARHLFSRVSLSFAKCTAKPKGQNTCRGCGRQLWKLPRHAIMMDKSCYF